MKLQHSHTTTGETALSQHSVVLSQEGSKRTQAWEVVEALRVNSEWRSLGEAVRQNMPKATDNSTHSLEPRGRNSCLLLNLRDKCTIHKQKLQNG